MLTIFSQLKNALKKSSDKIAQGIEQIFRSKKIDQDSLNALEDLLISADISVQVVQKLLTELAKTKFQQEISPIVIKEFLAEQISQVFCKLDNNFTLTPNQLNIVLVCGVNGNGKTTTIGKIAEKYGRQGLKIAVAACDTFRAGAVMQLEVWAKRSNAKLFIGSQGSDPSSVAYKAIQTCKDEQVDLLLIDTAGRLQNYQNLMDELAKIVRVIKKIDPTSPHHSLIVIDATTGQNAHKQVEQFNKYANLTGIIVTKLDSSAKAGALVGIADKFCLPIHFIGIGEQLDDLKEFNSVDFAKALVDINDK